MFRFRYLIAAALVVTEALTGRAQTTDIHGTWTAELRAGKVFLQMRTPSPPERNGDRSSGDWSTGQSYPVDEFTGIPRNDENFTVSSIRFDLRREAGSLAFDGAFRDGRGAGLFTFTPRPEFTAEMRAAGYTDDLPFWRRFQLAAHNVGPKFIRELKTEGFDTLSLDLIQRAKTHGVTTEYIKGMKAEGYRAVTLEELVRTRDHGVTPEFVAEMRGLGLSVSTLDAFVRLRDHGISAAYIRELGAQGFKNVPIEDVVRTKDHGVSADYITDMKELGLKDLTLAQIVRLRDHGITPGFVNHARSRGFKPTDVDEIIRLKNGGLSRGKP